MSTRIHGHIDPYIVSVFWHAMRWNIIPAAWWHANAPPPKGVIGCWRKEHFTEINSSYKTHITALQRFLGFRSRDSNDHVTLMASLSSSPSWLMGCVERRWETVLPQKGCQPCSPLVFQGNSLMHNSMLTAFSWFIAPAFSSFNRSETDDIVALYGTTFLSPLWVRQILLYRFRPLEISR
jgi:hypothetical protein